MGEAKHSPLPWTQDGVSVLDVKGREIAETWGYQMAKMAMPDAAFIVEVVNSHDKLIADKKALLDALHEIVDTLFQSPEDFAHWIESARKAINQAEKEG